MPSDLARCASPTQTNDPTSVTSFLDGANNFGISNSTFTTTRNAAQTLNFYTKNETPPPISSNAVSNPLMIGLLGSHDTIDILPAALKHLKPDEEERRKLVKKGRWQSPPGWVASLLDPCWIKFMRYSVVKVEDSFADLRRKSFIKPPSLIDQETLEGQLKGIIKIVYEYGDAFEGRERIVCRRHAAQLMTNGQVYCNLVSLSIKSAMEEPPEPSPLAHIESYEPLNQRRIKETSVHHVECPMVHYDEALCRDAMLLSVEWVDRKRWPDKTIFWLHGLSGCGKSSLAYVLVKDLYRRAPCQLVASFFFKGPPVPHTTRKELERAFLLNLLVEMGDCLKDAHFIAMIYKHGSAREKDVPGLWEGSLVRQFQQVVIPAYKELYPPTSTSPRSIVVVVDNINKMTIEARLAFFEMLQESVTSIPSIQYLLTGHWDEDLSRRLETGPLSPHVHSQSMEAASLLMSDACDMSIAPTSPAPLHNWLDHVPSMRQ